MQHKFIWGLADEVAAMEKVSKGQEGEA